MNGEVRWFRTHGGYVLRQQAVVERRERLLPESGGGLAVVTDVVWRDVPLTGMDGSTLIIPEDRVIVDVAGEVPEA